MDTCVIGDARRKIRTLDAAPEVCRPVMFECKCGCQSFKVYSYGYYYETHTECTECGRVDIVHTG